ncbi:hypothetical protein ACFO3A_12815 [Comamonas nitrativorans]|uniref:CopG family transcriptional regulator n=1 Tax=Comamonas nitrativorans TaxID=108437 RepID=A0ABV9GYQ5_9BURK
MQTKPASTYVAPRNGQRLRTSRDEILYVRIAPPDAQEMRRLADKEDCTYAAMVRKLLGLGLRTYPSGGHRP